MKPLKPYQILSKEMKAGPGRNYTGSYSLLALGTPTGRHYYFISAYRRTGPHEELEVSPVVAADLDRAVAIFELLAGQGQVAPVHLADVVQDLRLSDPELPTGGTVRALP